MAGRVLGEMGNTRSVPMPENTAPLDIEGLQRAFEHPPDDCRIMMRWWWFGPCATQTEIEREIQAMKEVGIGGFEINPVYPLMLDDPASGFRNYLYLSDEHLRALHFASAKAFELGMRMDLTLGSGWPFGAANVPASEAAAILRIENVAVKPGVDRVAVPATSAGEKVIAAFLAPGYPQSIVAGKALQITAVENEAVRVPRDLDGPHALVFFISSRTGQQVKRAALGAEGFVLDHYDRAAVQHYLASVGDRLMQAFGSNPPRAIFCDSLEVYGSNWTTSFMEDFRKRRGYDLTPYLPALAGDIGEKTTAIRHDWGQTLTELFNENFVLPMQEWSRQHKTPFRAQLYGIPPALLSSYRVIDLPEGEGAHWKSFAPTRWASSAGHLYGRPVISSETWTWLHSPAFRATPLDMKAEADLHFLQGINQLVGHGWPYSPPEAGEPGWRFYAAAALNAHNPWWRVMPDITSYLARVSLVLRQGNPVNTVAIYLPTDDAWARFVPGKVSNLESGNASVSETIEFLLGTQLIPRVLEAGYGFDFIDDEVISELAKIESGALAVNENRYPIVILPGIERIQLATLKKLAQFAAQGGILVATRRKPSLAPGLNHREEEIKQIRQLAGELFEGSRTIGHFVHDENVQLARVLTSLHPADVTFSPPVSDLGFVQRRSGSAEFYFLANTANAPRHTQATLRVGGEAVNAEWWDPFTGTVGPAHFLAREKGTATVALDLEPFGSRILVFSDRRPAATPTSQSGYEPTLAARATRFEHRMDGDVRQGGQANSHGSPAFLDRRQRNAFLFGRGYL